MCPKFAERTLCEIASGITVMVGVQAIFSDVIEAKMAIFRVWQSFNNPYIRKKALKVRLKAKRV